MTSMAGKLASHRSNPVASTRVSISVLVPSVLTMPSASMRCDAVGLQVHVRLGERAVVAVGECRPLAAEVVVRGEPAAQLLVADRREAVHLRQVRRGDVEPAEVPVVNHRGVDHELVDRIGQPADGALRQRDSGEQPLGPLAEPQVDLGHHPDRGALVDGQVGDPLGQFGDELDGGGAGADDGDPAARRVEVVVPGGGVDDLAREVGRCPGCRAPSAGTGSPSR